MRVARPQKLTVWRRVRARAAIFAACLGLAAAAPGVGGDPELRRQARRAAEEGRAFAVHCGACHGIDGRGGGRAPDITAGAAAQLAEPDLERIVQNGIPARGMPAFAALGPAGIKSVVAYLRTLQGRAVAVSANGSPDRGRELFFGSAKCSDCHMVRGLGGFLGPDLSAYARSHSPDSIRQAIAEPDRARASTADSVTAATDDGRTLTGLARNEDNFSLQLQTPDGTFHLLLKSDLASVTHSRESLMPADYASRLKARDLDDIVSFLVSAGAGSMGPGEKSGPP